MKELDTTISKNGFTYEQLVKSERAYMYAQSVKGSNKVIGMKYSKDAKTSLI